MEITKKSIILDKYCWQVTGKWYSEHNMVIVHLYNVELISIQFLSFIFGNFDGDIGAQTVLDPDAATF